MRGGAGRGPPDVYFPEKLGNQSPGRLVSSPTSWAGVSEDMEQFSREGSRIQGIMRSRSCPAGCGLHSEKIRSENSTDKKGKHWEMMRTVSLRTSPIFQAHCASDYSIGRGV